MPDSLPPIRHPSRFVPLSAVATGVPGEPALPVSATNPVPCRDQPLRGARMLSADIAVEPGIALLVDCSVAGLASFTLEDGSTLSLTLAPGLTMLPLAVSTVASANQTAQFDAWVLD
ncbi:hypothetical protein [Parerythrobacter jejuensis]|uniref:Uncharacterized protein n=1 Tax=Parerythrobacter jejuensis TaxID=795812 RepID=A0A845ANR4_9SPHN|nr:hypothetical protein [Parerythrobacter jejuensis]MXP31099.1 hypothetical protein [Parerythrobacter jejuensis]MXP33859.1 hypothetical protein [Parerythrobacter jejuensis]